MSIECTKFTPVNKGTLVGYANLFVPKMGLEINGCSLIDKDGKRWVNLPSREYDDKGVKKWAPVIKFRDQKTAYAFSDAAKVVIEEKMREQQAPVSMQEMSFDDDGPLPF